MTSIKKLLPVSFIILLQIGCAENPIYQKPAPVIRHHSKAIRNDPSKSVQTFGYPETGTHQDRPKFQEIVPESTVAVPVAPAPAPSANTSTSDSPAVLALVAEADQNSQVGQYESAAVKIERALRIDSRNATLTYKLASIRLKQEQPRLAEDLAKKAALLASGDRALKKRIWLLIADSKRLQQDTEGAKQAEQKAAEY